MNSNEFRENGQNMVEYITSYLETVEQRRVVSAVEPGYLAPLLPKEAPHKPEPWNQILRDVEDKIMPGLTHWQHPHFHAYFPNAASYPSILGDMLSSAVGCLGFSWASSPACSELETVVLDWVARALGLPKHFIFSEPGATGGGVLESSASEAILMPMLAARTQAIRYLRQKSGSTEAHDSVFLPKLVAYCSKEAHSSVEKAAMIALVQVRILDTDEKCSLRGQILKKAIDEDVAEGLHPFYVCCTLGTTGCTSFDSLKEIGPMVRELPACWLHADGAYGGNSFICPEMRGPMAGIEHVDSINVNPNKWLLVNFDCSCLWVKDRLKLASALVVDPLYLQHENSKVTLDYRHWGVALSRRFRALKLWFTLRSYGIEGLQKYIRNHCVLAKEFEKRVLSDPRFEVVNDVKLGLVCFRLRGPDLLNQELLAIINSTGRLHMIPSKVKGHYAIRFVVCHEKATAAHVEYAWNEITHQAEKVLEAHKYGTKPLVSPNPDKHRRFSFTRSVSRQDYVRSQSRNSLQDEATPIAVPDDLHLTADCDFKDNFPAAKICCGEKNKLDSESRQTHMGNVLVHERISGAMGETMPHP